MGKLLRSRQEFPSVSRCTYLYAGRLGPMHRQVPEALERYALDWETRCGAGWVESWRDAAAPVTAGLAQILECQPEQLQYAESAESAARQIPISPEGLIAFEASSENPSAQAPDWFPIFTRYKTLPLFSHETSALLHSIETERPAYLVICHASPLTGALRTSEELAALSEAAEKVGTKIIIDIERTVGVVPITLSGAMYAAVGVCSRWLCAGPGGAFLWLKETKVSPPPLPPLSFFVAESSVRLIAQIGVGAIRKKSMKQTQKIVDGALARGFAVRSPKDAALRGGTVSVVVPHSKAVFYALRERRYLVDFHQEAGLLVSPHFYNEDNELDALLSQIDDIVDRRDYERFLNK